MTTTIHPPVDAHAIRPAALHRNDPIGRIGTVEISIERMADRSFRGTGYWLHLSHCSVISIVASIPRPDYTGR